MKYGFRGDDGDRLSVILNKNQRMIMTSRQHEHLTHCILVDSSTITCLTSPFVILGVSGLLCRFYSIFDGNPVSKQCRP